MKPLRNITPVAFTSLGHLFHCHLSGWVLPECPFLSTPDFLSSIVTYSFHVILFLYNWLLPFLLSPHASCEVLF